MRKECKLIPEIVARRDLTTGEIKTAGCGGTLSRQPDQTKGDLRRSCYGLGLCANCPLRNMAIEDIAGIVTNAGNDNTR